MDAVLLFNMCDCSGLHSHTCKSSCACFSLQVQIGFHGSSLLTSNFHVVILKGHDHYIFSIIHMSTCLPQSSQTQLTCWSSIISNQMGNDG